MKPLPETFPGRRDQKDWNFTQLKRVGDVALFVKEKNGLKSWEVFKVKKNAERIIAGVVIPAAESTPSSNDWGTEGWTYLTLKDAENGFTSRTKTGRS